MEFACFKGKPLVYTVWSGALLLSSAIYKGKQAADIDQTIMDMIAGLHI